MKIYIRVVVYKPKIDTVYFELQKMFSNALVEKISGLYDIQITMDVADDHEMASKHEEVKGIDDIIEIESVSVS